jgi:hypothetical protein
MGRLPTRTVHREVIRSSPSTGAGRDALSARENHAFGVELPIKGSVAYSPWCRLTAFCLRNTLLPCLYLAEP